MLIWNFWKICTINGGNNVLVPPFFGEGGTGFTWLLTSFEFLIYLREYFS